MTRGTQAGRSQSALPASYCSSAPRMGLPGPEPRPWLDLEESGDANQMLKAETVSSSVRAHLEAPYSLPGNQGSSERQLPGPWLIS